ncbi:Ada metal-binding domain-containing protein [Chryseobacterium paridis]|uniref:Metal-binding protein n=1 Tax=Chryseobacterium paridis TaxID=2800328 RepID=A0ABS1FXP0_9FLAO|nr:Ada metal-binding domain-containing protein [Chryseobacterium paridis]MBK1897206.1 metal-binding protein [Chryseobacterium paridis]
MIKHTDLGETPEKREKTLRSLIRKGDVALAGYVKAKIYGLLSCSSGKRMKPENRVFFKNEVEALGHGYRPCGHCMKEKYEEWKKKK